MSESYRQSETSAATNDKSQYSDEYASEVWFLPTQSSKMGTVTKGFDARLANGPFLFFWFLGILAINPERQSARK